MSRNILAAEILWLGEQPTPKEAEALQQASDSFVLIRVKQLLQELWIAGRITNDVRLPGESILSAALHAIEHPDLRQVSAAQGACQATAQLEREEEQSHDPF